MISVAEVITDPDLIAPQPYTVLRSTGSFQLGGFQSTTVSIAMFGPVQNPTPKEIAMLPEADRVGGVYAFWSTQPIYVTRGSVALPAVHGETPNGSGPTYTLSSTPPSDAVCVYANGLLLKPGLDYTLTGDALTMLFVPGAPYVTWPIAVQSGQSASDIIQYEANQYRVVSVYRDPGGGYWKAMARRLNAA